MHAHTRSMCVRVSVFMDVCVLTLLLILGQNLVVVHGAAECAPGAAAGELRHAASEPPVRREPGGGSLDQFRPAGGGFPKIRISWRTQFSGLR